MELISNYISSMHSGRRLLLRCFVFLLVAHLADSQDADGAAGPLSLMSLDEAATAGAQTSAFRAQRAAAAALRAAEDFFAEADKVVQQRKQELQQQHEEEERLRVKRAIEKARMQRQCTPPNSSSLCSGHGGCNDTVGVCTCDADWTGQFCDTQLCSLNCSSRGLCVSGSCVCDEHYMGQLCEYERCPGDCNGNGYCFAGRCQCNSGYDGEDCAMMLQLGEVIHFKLPEALPKLRGFGDQGASTLRSSGERTCAQDCNGHGTCGEDGTCSCAMGFSGASCDVFCPSGCSGHGMCMNGACLCNAGYEEADCSVVSACSGHGQTSAYGCHCDQGWTGAQCGIEMVCADAQCGGHGVCTHGMCLCSMGYTGETCTELIINTSSSELSLLSAPAAPMSALALEAAPVVFLGHDHLASMSLEDGRPVSGTAALEYRRRHVTSDAQAAPVMSLASGTLLAAKDAAVDLAQGGQEALQAAKKLWDGDSTSSSQATDGGGAVAAAGAKEKAAKSPLTASWIKPGKARKHAAAELPKASAGAADAALKRAEVALAQSDAEVEHSEAAPTPKGVRPHVVVAQPQTSVSGDLMSLLTFASGNKGSSSAATPSKAATAAVEKKVSLPAAQPLPESEQPLLEQLVHGEKKPTEAAAAAAAAPQKEPQFHKSAPGTSKVLKVLLAKAASAATEI